MLYESIEHRAELKLSRHLPDWTMCDLFQDFSLAFFSLIESDISKTKAYKHAKRNARLSLAFLPTLLSFSNRFLRTLQQNRAQSWLLYLLIRKPFQCSFIPPSLVSLSLIRTAAGCDLKFFPYIVSVFEIKSYSIVNVEKQKLIDIPLRKAKMDRKF